MRNHPTNYGLPFGYIKSVDGKTIDTMVSVTWKHPCGPNYLEIMAGKKDRKIIDANRYAWLCGDWKPKPYRSVLHLFLAHWKKRKKSIHDVSHLLRVDGLERWKFIYYNLRAKKHKAKARSIAIVWFDETG